MIRLSSRVGVRAGLALTMSVVAAAATVPVAHAFPPTPIRERVVQLALDGTFSGFGTSEPIDITGTVQIAVHTQPSDDGTQVRINTNLADTTGIGQESGGTYRFTGSDTLERFYPPVPVEPLTITFFPIFKMWPPTPILPPHPVQPVQFVNETIVIAVDGSIAAGISGGGGTDT